MRLLTTFILLTIYLTATGQISPTKKEGWFRVDTLFAHYGESKKTRPHYSYGSIDTEVKYSDSKGKSVTIQNSLQRGGLPYIDPTGKSCSYLIYWIRIINETDSPLELTMNFADSFASLPAPYAYLFLPPDTMTSDKESLFNYGITSLESFQDADTIKPTKLKRTLNPKDECLFNIGMLLKGGDGPGPGRAALVLKGQQLFYSMRGFDRKLDSALIPCGQIVFKK